MMDMELRMKTPGVRMSAMTGNHPLMASSMSWGNGPPSDFGFGADDQKWYGIYKQVKRGTTGVQGEWNAEFEGSCVMERGQIGWTNDQGRPTGNVCDAQAPPSMRLWHPDRPPAANPEAVEEELFFAQVCVCIRRF